ncbi:MAG: hypothetical protein KJ955_06715 [Nanoarchaeota archaeon]|nr:hypothetical protein [Nanoarchaeota archaeon]
MKKEASAEQSALTEFSHRVLSKSKKKPVAKDSPVNITAVTNKIALQLVKEKLFKTKKEALEAALGFFYIWYSNPEEFEKLNAKRNTAPPETIRTVQDITSDILMRLPTRKDVKPESIPQELPAQQS